MVANEVHGEKNPYYQRQGDCGLLKNKRQASLGTYSDCEMVFNSCLATLGW